MVFKLKEAHCLIVTTVPMLAIIRQLSTKVLHASYERCVVVAS